MGTLQQADHYLLSFLQTFIQPVTPQAMNLLPKKKRVRSAEKKEADKLRLKRKREDAAATLLENEALKKAIKTKDESMAAMYEEIAVLKQQIAIDGNARANRAERIAAEG